MTILTTERPIEQLIAGKKIQVRKSWNSDRSQEFIIIRVERPLGMKCLHITTEDFKSFVEFIPAIQLIFSEYGKKEEADYHCQQTVSIALGSNPSAQFFRNSVLNGHVKEKLTAVSTALGIDMRSINLATLELPFSTYNIPAYLCLMENEEVSFSSMPFTPDTVDSSVTPMIIDEDNNKPMEH